MAFTILGRVFSFNVSTPATPIVEEDVSFAADFSARAEKLLEDGKIQPIQVHIMEGVFHAIADGLVDLKMGRVKRARLVYPIS